MAMVEMAPLQTSSPTPKAVCFDLAMGDPFTTKRAPPRALLERLNHPVAKTAEKLREQREAEAKESSEKKEKDGENKKETGPPRSIKKPSKPATLRDSKPATLRDSADKPEKPASIGPKEVVQIGVGVGIADQPQQPIAPPAELTEEQREKSSKMIAVFGEEIVRGLYSQKWIHRMDTMKEVTASIFTYKSSKKSVKTRMLEVFMQVVATLLLDSVLQVYLQCMEFFKLVVGDFASDINPDVLKEHLGPLLPTLLQRTGDMNSRICGAASDVFLFLAAQPQVGVSFVSEFCTAPIENMNAFKQVIARLNLILALITEYNFGHADSGLSPERVMAVIVDALNGSNPRVRKQASLVVVEAYKRLGKRTEMYLRGCKPSTLKFLKTEIEVELCDIDALTDADVKTQEEDDLHVVEQFSEEETRKMQPLVEAFGPGISCLFSKKWKLRENALDRLRQQLDLGNIWGDPLGPNAQAKTPNIAKKSFMHCCRVLMIGLQDAVPIVYTMSCNVLQSALEAYSEAIGENDFKLGMENIITLLISRAGDLNTAVKTTTLETLTAVAKQQKIGVGFVATYLLSPIENLNQWRIVVARLELLEVFVQQFGFNTGGLSTEATMTFAVGTFQSPNGKVRKAAVNLILEVYKKAGNIVRTYLRNQKPALVNELKSKIMKIARKDRTKSAPIQRLANIVQPLGVEEEEAKDSARKRPKSFPNTLGDMETSETMSMRERVQEWKKEKESTNPEPEYEEDGHVVIGKAQPRPAADATSMAMKNMNITQMPGPGVKMSDGDVQGRPKKSVIRGRMVFQ
jgi:hypothetical protein